MPQHYHITLHTEINANHHGHTGLGGHLIFLDQFDVKPLQHDSP